MILIKCNASRLDNDSYGFDFDKKQLVGNVHHGKVELHFTGESRGPGNSLRSWSMSFANVFVSRHNKTFGRATENSHRALKRSILN